MNTQQIVLKGRAVRRAGFLALAAVIAAVGLGRKVQASTDFTARIKQAQDVMAVSGGLNNDFRTMQDWANFWSNYIPWTNWTNWSNWGNYIRSW